ncbi:MAG: protein kinase [Polyangiaceae bacterium]|nr:protein kinase [Polyangiaceae bacterium]
MSASVETMKSVGVGRFVLECPVGAGGMGTVYRALDRETGAPVAVKLLTGRSTADVARFFREARVLSEIENPAVVRYIAHGHDPRPYLVMEWLDGCDLAQHLAHERLSIADSVALIRRVARTLASVHARGIVHRDLKPSNLFLVRERLEEIKIIDFGIALASHPTRAITASNAILGTPEYMAPEQVREGRQVDVRADVFSLGCVLFHCLAGKPPFTGIHPMAVLAKLLLEEVPDVAELRDDMPEALAGLVKRMLCKDPAGRPVGAGALAAELDALDLRGRRRPSEFSLTGEEDRLVSVLVVGSIEAPPVDAPALEAKDIKDGEGPEDSLEETLTLGPSQKVRLAVAGAALRYGGHMNWLVDGTLVVVFPDAEVATDAANRAARCALELIALVPEHPASLVMGWRREGFGSPIGDLLERGAGLLEASRGRVRIDSLTAGLLDARFEVEPNEQGFSLKGERAVAGTARKVLGKAVPFVGRGREMMMLQGFVEEAESSAQAVLLTGEPGVGKSRLRHELLQWARGRSEPVTIWIARGDPMRAGAPLGMLGDLVRQAAQIQIGEEIAVRRKKLVDRAARHVGAAVVARVAEFLGEIIGTRFQAEQPPSTPEWIELRAARQDKMLMADQMRRAWLDFLEAECRAQPVILVLEDLQWGDRATVDYIDASLRVLKQLRLFVLALARPEVKTLFPDLWAARGLSQMRLSGLSRKACERLSAQLLGASGTPEVAEGIWTRSAGNPFLLEELVRARGAGLEGDLPETALAMVQSRLAGFDAEARRLVRAASVFGRAFWPGGLRALLGKDTTAAEIDARLSELVEREWIVERAETSRKGEQEYAFMHDLMREAAYAMLTGDNRKLGHALAARWLEQNGETDPLVLAQHFELGGGKERAVRWYREAAERALAGNDFTGAIERAERAIQLGAAEEVLGEVSAICADAHRWRGEIDPAERWALAALDSLPAGSERWYTVVALLSDVSQQLGHHERLGTLCDTLEMRWLAEIATGPQVAAMAGTARRLLFIGAYDRALSLVAKVEMVADRFEDNPGVIGQIWAVRGLLATFTGDTAAAVEKQTRAAQCFERAGNLRMACLQRSNLASDENELGACADAVEHLRRALVESERMGLVQIAGVAKQNLGLSLLCLGAMDEAKSLLEQSITSFAAMGDRRMEGCAHLYLARALLRTGDLARAEAEARRGVDFSQVAPVLEPQARAVLAQVLLRAGQPEKALDEARRAMERLDALGTIEEGESLVRLVYVKGLEATGDAEGAIAALRAAYTRLNERAASISKSRHRTSFLQNVAENAQTIELFGAWASGRWPARRLSME